VDQAVCLSREEFWVVLSEVFETHYTSLVRLAAIYLDRTAEDAVQEAFVQVSLCWHRIRDADKVLPYVRRAVFNEAKSQLRHRLVVRKHPMLWPASAPASEDVALTNLTDDAVVLAIRRLPTKQAACVGLHYYLNLSEKEIAEVLGIRAGSVKQHMSRARQKLRPVLRTSHD
jgi:RNA polymerase sigma factor (sigma-70 family)